MTKFKVGDVAGVGCMVNSCGKCKNCLAGEEQYCSVAVNWTYGFPEKENVYSWYASQQQEMMDYSYKHGIYAMVEVIPIEEVNKAFKKVMNGDVLFRYVIDMSTLK